MVFLYFLAFQINPNAHLVEGPWLVEFRGNQFGVQRIDQPNQKMTSLKGQLIALNQNGVVFEAENKWYFFDAQLERVDSLPNPETHALFSALPQCSGPAFFNETNVLRFVNGAWKKIAFEIFIEALPPKNIAGSQHGLNLIYPQIWENQEGDWRVYQPKTGDLTFVSNSQQKTEKSHFGKHRRAEMVGNRVFWLGAPKKTRISLANQDNIRLLGAEVSVPHLDKYSLSFAAKKGVWLVTFPSGFRDGLKSWDTGLLPVGAHYVRVNASQKLVLSTTALGKLPLNFHLTTSSSGSPRLEIKPQFSIMPVYGTEQIAVLLDGELRLVDPKHPLKKHLLKNQEKSLVSVVKSGRNLAGYDANGQWKIIMEGMY